MKDEQLQNQLARVMLIGVVIAAAIMGAGLVWFLVTHEGLPPGDHIFRGEPKYFENGFHDSAHLFRKRASSQLDHDRRCCC
jgi:hypothetical protein